MKEKIGGVYKALQDLDVKPTPGNARILTAVFNTLEDVYQRMEDAENGRAQADNESRAEPDRAAGQ